MMKKLMIVGLLLAACAGSAKASWTNVPSTSAPAGYDVVPASFTLVAADSGAGNSFKMTGRDFVIVYNSDASAHTITFYSTPDSSGRTGDSTKNVNAGAYYITQVFPLNGWQQSDGTLHFTASDATMKVAVIHLP